MIIHEFNEGETKIVCIIQNYFFSSDSDEKLKVIETFKDEQDTILAKTKILYRSDSKDFRASMIVPSNHEVIKR